MVNRSYMVCDSCKKIYMIRVQIGNGDLQEHGFCCSNCGIEISFSVSIDQKNISFEYSDPVNGTWTNWVDDSNIEIRTFASDLVVPKDLGGHFSPYLAQAGQLVDMDKYAKEENIRCDWKKKQPKQERALIHFEKGDDHLWDEAMRDLDAIPGNSNTLERLTSMQSLFEQRYLLFTHNTKADYLAIKRRISLATNRKDDALKMFAEDFLNTGRLEEIWHETKNIRAQILNCYDSILPLIRLFYWNQFPDYSEFTIEQKNFRGLRALYSDAFETLCRLLDIMVAFEGIIKHGTTNVQTKKASLPIWTFSAKSNGMKRDHWKQHEIYESFEKGIDTKLRNALNHHASRYDLHSDTVICHTNMHSHQKIWKISYNEFVVRVLDTYSAFELARVYFDELLRLVDGRLIGSTHDLKKKKNIL